MADTVPSITKQPAQSSSERDELAFKIYAQRVAVAGVRFNGEREALDSFQRAQAFMDARDKVRSGALNVKPPTGPQLCNCSAPNLEPTHPHNLVSQRFGDLEKVNRIKKWLDAHPTPEDATELVNQIAKDFPDLRSHKGERWDLPTINVARILFHDYCEAK